MRNECPTCGEQGRPVSSTTINAIRNDRGAALFEDAASFCRSAACDVVYYDTSGRTLDKRQVAVRVGVKEQEDPIPLCYCFGITRADIRAEIARTGASMIAERIAADTKARRCDCERKNPSGSCCLGEVQKIVAETQRGRASND